MKKIGLVVLLMCLLLSGVAQEKNKEFRQQTWTAYFNQSRLSDKWGLWTDIHFRFTENFGERLGLTIFRVAPMYYVTDQTRISSGYGYITSYNVDPVPDLPEHRLWQQIQWFEKKKALSLAQYFRVEERFRRTLSGNEVSEDYTFSWRFRYNFAVTIPLTRKTVEPKTPFLFLNDEVHVSAGKHIGNNYLDQNRVFAGVGYQFTAQVNAQIGYLYVFQQLPASNTFIHTDAIRLFLFHNLDFRNKE
ncbi:MAG: hypothetical protein UZ12_BCD005001678 [Bacteroidetes bacterium OLB12]|nr:MAG: hypothetical protein UZ12_BCD005001678 [Bacteroidetes bacterium OLB12]HNU41582.1 DUF2490 domain-containing protein [Cyclobacteriaceae bacterium]